MYLDKFILLVNNLLIDVILGPLEALKAILPHRILIVDDDSPC